MSLILQGFGEEGVCEFSQKFKLKKDKFSFSKKIINYKFKLNIIKKHFLIKVEDDCKT